MTRLSLFLISLLALGAFAQEEETAPETRAPETLTERSSYAIGHSMGKSLVGDGGVEFDIEMMVQGLRDAFAGSTQMTEQEMDAALLELQKAMIAANAEKDAEKAAPTLAAGKAFLEENGAREGVMTTDSGLQYEVIVAGEGRTPLAHERVRVHYTGTLIDGTEFDSSRDGAPATFGVSQVIKGWVEGLQLMPLGSRYKLYIPSELAYGNQQVGPVIAPGSTLIFDVELLEILD